MMDHLYEDSKRPINTTVLPDGMWPAGGAAEQRMLRGPEGSGRQAVLGEYREWAIVPGARGWSSRGEAA